MDSLRLEAEPEPRCPLLISDAQLQEH